METAEVLANFFGNKGNIEKIAEIMKMMDKDNAMTKLDDILKELDLPTKEKDGVIEYVKKYYSDALQKRLKFSAEPCW